MKKTIAIEHIQDTKKKSVILSVLSGENTVFDSFQICIISW